MKRFVSVFILIMLLVSMMSSVSIAANIMENKIQSIVSTKIELTEEQYIATQNALNKSNKDFDSFIDKIHNDIKKIDKLDEAKRVEIINNNIKELQEKGFKTYTVDSTNFLEVKKALNNNLEAVIDSSFENSVAYIIAISISDEAILSKNNVNNTTAFQFRDYYIYPLPYTQTGQSTDKIISSSTNSVSNLMNKSFSVGTGLMSPAIWIPLTVIGFNPSDYLFRNEEYYKISCTSEFTTRVVEVYDSVYNAWVVSAKSNKVRWTQFDAYKYFDKKQYGFVNSGFGNEGIIKAPYYDDYYGLCGKAASAFNSRSIYYDHVGNVQFKVEGITKVTHFEAFGF